MSALDVSAASANVILGGKNLAGQTASDQAKYGGRDPGGSPATADVAGHERIYFGTVNDQSTPVAGETFTMNALLVASRSSDPGKGGWSPIGRLEFDQGTYRFVYTKGVRTAAGFTPFNGMEDLEEIYESDELLPVFANRLIPKSRPEYQAYLRWSAFDPANPPDPIAILGVTEGIRQTDLIEVFPCPVPDATGC